LSHGVSKLAKTPAFGTLFGFSGWLYNHQKINTMKFSRLITRTYSTLLVATFLLAFSACRNSDDSDNEENNTTVTHEVTGTDTTGTFNDSTSLMNSRGNKVDSTSVNHGLPGGDTSTRNNQKQSTKKNGKVSASIAVPDKTSPIKTDKAGFYNYTETAPIFAGGQSGLETYINNNLEYPQDAMDNSVEGTVNVIFTIDENGKVGNVKTSGNNPGYGLNEAAMKAISAMPAWTPGKIKGKNVKAWYTLPVTYRIE
jgi:periplasmic protein TonB